jgi:amino acid adenylation domain-containing protein
MRTGSNQDLLELWARAVKVNARAPAVIETGRRLTFGELDAWADSLARELRAAGTQPGDIVALCDERSAGAIAAILAVFKCGAAYLPIEPHLPPARRELMLADARPRVLLAGNAAALPDGIAAIEIAAQRAAAGRDCAATAAFPAGRALYVLYTSGSSGAPKGVIGTHPGLINRLQWMWREFPFAAGERVAHRTNLGFVDSVAEVWGALLAGVPIVLIAPSTVADVDAFISEIGAAGVTRLVVVPSLLETVLSAGRNLAATWRSLSVCVTSGEALPRAVAERFRATLPNCRLLNIYGMTEAAADATCSVVALGSADDSVRIGKPIDGMQVRVLDEALNPVAPGEVGQVYISGVGLAQGYLGRAALTAEKFLPDPYADGGARMYATGDFALRHEDDEFEYRGRRDGQVKVRGHRVELDEIERAALEHTAVAQCVAGLTPGGADLQLVVVVRAGTQVTARGLKDHLRHKLPAYAIPAFVHVRDSIPLLPNGKLDRRAALQATFELRGGAPLSDATQRRVALIWQELLRSDAIGSDGNYFDLGGNSLNGALAVTRLRGEFGVSLGIAEFLESATLADLARLLDERVALDRVRSHAGHEAETELVEF